MAADFDAAVRQPVAKARIFYESQMMDTNKHGQMLDDYFEGIGSQSQLCDGVEAPSARWFTLSESRLDSGHALYAEGLQIGAKCPAMAGSDGTYGINFPYYWIFYGAVNRRSITRIRLIGDALRGAYPVDFVIRIDYGYSGAHYDLTVTGNASAVYEFTMVSVIDLVYQMSVTVNKWSLPYDYATILEFSADNYIDLAFEDLAPPLSILRERRIEGQGIPYGTMAAHELQMSFLKDPGIDSSTYRANVPITLQLGTGNDYVPSGRFFATKWNLDDRKIASVIAHDWLAILSDDEMSYLDLANNKSVGQLITAILVGSKIPPGLWITSGLEYVPPVVAIPRMTTFKAVALLLTADNGVAVMDNDGICTFKDDAFGASVKTLDGTNHIMRGLANPSDSGPLATVIDVAWYTYTVDATLTNVLDANESIVIPPGLGMQGIDFTYDWQGSDYVAVDSVQAPVITVTGPGAPSFTYWVAANYTGGVKYRFLNGSGTDSLTITHITVQGKPVRANRHVYEAVDGDAINKYGRIVWTLDNPLIQSYSQATSIGDALIARYNSPNKLWQIPSRCDPQLHPDDVVTIPQLISGTVDVQIERQLITFGSGGAGLKETLIARAQ